MRAKKGLLGLVAVSSILALMAGCADSGPEVGTRTEAVKAAKRYIVAFKGTGGKSAVNKAGGKLVRNLDKHGAGAFMMPEQALKGLRNNPNIEYIEEDPKRYLQAETVPYGITAVQADLVTEAASPGKKVCIIDTGYDFGHPDLPTAGVSGYAFSGHGVWSQDGYGHGTHVAGTIAGIGGNSIGVVGVNPDNTIGLYIVKYFNDAGDATYASDLIAALGRCEDNGATVINMSLGGPSKSKTEDKAFARAYGRGVLSIAAAGNDGNTRKSYPASYASVVSVAAVDSNNAIADFSQQNSAVELAAPGVGVLSTLPRGNGRAVTFTVAGAGYEAAAMEGSPVGTATGNLVDCGLGTNTCAATGGKVCLIQRGDIAFSDKVLACQNGGGSAAIVYNNEPGILLATLGGVATTIPSAGISMADGATLKGIVAGAPSASLALAASDYEAWDGTSMATPHVAGVAALLWNLNPGKSNADIRAALTSTAIDLGDAGRDNAYGYGLIQAQAANNALGGGCTPTTEICDDGVDNDCDGLVDAADPDCATPPDCSADGWCNPACAPGADTDCATPPDCSADGWCNPACATGADPDCSTPTCWAKGTACTSATAANCCSGLCHPKKKTCK